VDSDQWVVNNNKKLCTGTGDLLVIDSLELKAYIPRSPADSNSIESIIGFSKVLKKPETRIPKPETRNLKPETRNLKPKLETRNQKLETRNPKPETRNSKPETRETNWNVSLP
jgi:hypothetical protein